MKYYEVDELTDKELSDALYDWNCAMCHSFNGTPYPADVPRFDPRGAYKHKGQHLAFYALKEYAEKRLQKPLMEIIKGEKQ